MQRVKLFFYFSDTFYDVYRLQLKFYSSNIASLCLSLPLKMSIESQPQNPELGRF